MPPAAVRTTLLLAALAGLLGGCGGCGRSDGADPGALRPDAGATNPPGALTSAELAPATGVASQRTESLPAAANAPAESAPPEVGSIEVRILGADGEPDVECMGAIYLVEAQPGEANFDDLAWGDDVTGRAARAAGGAARFDDLPLGRHWATRYVSNDWLGAPPSRSGAGPQERGQRVVLDLVDGAGSRVTGRLVDESGASIGATHWRFRASTPSRPILQVTTDAGGRFSLALDLAELGGAACEVRRMLRQFGSDEPTDRAGSFTFPAPESSERDLGDITVRALPVLASGIVVGVGGEPIVDARVGLDIGDETHGIRTGFYGFVEVRTGNDGTFVIPDDPRQRRVSAAKMETTETLWLTALAEGAAPATIEVQRGARDLRLELIPAGRMRARLVHEDQELCELFVCYAQHVESISRARGEPDGDTWTFEPLKPGSYRLELILSYTTEPLLVIDGLHVPSGGECVDPRIAPLRLDSHLGRARFDVRDAAGQAIEGVMLGFLNDSPGAWPGDVYWRREVPRDERGVWWPRPALRPLQVLVSAEGYRQSEARPLEALHRVVLERRRLLRIVPKDGLRIADSVQLFFGEQSYTMSDDGRTFELWDPEPGPMRVRYGSRWWLPKDDPERERPLEWCEFEVPEAQDLEIVLDLRQE